MALLGTDFDADAPSGTETRSLGDNKIKDIKARLKQWAEVEHDKETGRHKIHRGTTAPLDTPVTGQLYIKTSGSATELYEYNGTAWVALTRNQDVITYVSNLATHAASNPIDHADSSVTGAKIASGSIAAPHLHSSIQPLVDGSDADGLHSHASLASGIDSTHDHVGGDGAKIPQKAFADVASVGNYIIHENAPSRAVSEGSYTKKKESKMGRGGIFRIRFTLEGSGTVYGKIYRDSVAVGTERSTASGPEEYSEDISGWTAGDKIQIWCKGSGSVSGVKVSVHETDVLMEAALNGY